MITQLSPYHKLKAIPSSLKLLNGYTYLFKVYNTADDALVGWYMARKTGERSWDAFCVIEANSNITYKSNPMIIHGNSTNIVATFNKHNLYVKEGWRFAEIAHARQAVMSICISGQADNRIEANILAKE